MQLEIPHKIIVRITWLPRHDIHKNVGGFKQARIKAN